jgi:Transketolase, C-terminal domain
MCLRARSLVRVLAPAGVFVCGGWRWLGGNWGWCVQSHKCVSVSICVRCVNRALVHVPCQRGTYLDCMCAGREPKILQGTTLFYKKEFVLIKKLWQVINLRTIKPLDREAIVASVKKTHRLLSVEEGWPQSGVGSEIVALTCEEAFDELDAPPERVTGAEVPMPYAANLERAALPTPADIVATVKRILGK